MKGRRTFVSAFALVVLTLSWFPPASALEEPERLWLVGEKAFADGLMPLARRVLERFVTQYPNDPRLADAVLLLGKARLAQGDADAALEALRRAQTFSPVPGRPLEARFWEAEALFRLKRYGDARTAYDDVLRTDAASPLGPDALYGLAWSELEMKRPESAVAKFREFLSTWPEHALAPSATFYLARALVDLKRHGEALSLLTSFPTKYPAHKLAADAQYLTGVARIGAGDAKAGAADLRAFIAAYPSHPQVPAARRAIGEGVARGGDREEQEDAYRTLVAQNTPESLSEAATLAGQLKRPRDQDAALRKLQTGFPDHPLARRAALELANRAFQRKEWKDAASLATAAAKSDDDTMKAEAWLLAGESELKQKRLAPAVKAFEAASAVQEADAAVRYRALAGLGLAREEQQEWRAALKAYEAVASKSPDATLRDWAKQRAAAVRPRVNETPKGGDKKAKSKS
jgi:TolA-binding protein